MDWASSSKPLAASTSADPSRRAPLLAATRGAGALLLRIGRGWALLPLAAWMALIWSVSSISGRTLVAAPLPSAFLRNLAHAFEFGVLALFAALLAPRARGWARLDARACALVVLGVALYGVVDEVHQSRTPGRSATWEDVVTDLVGGASVLLVAAYAGRADATERGIWLRFGAAALACLASAGVATWVV